MTRENRAFFNRPAVPRPPVPETLSKPRKVFPVYSCDKVDQNRWLSPGLRQASNATEWGVSVEIASVDRSRRTGWDHRIDGDAGWERSAGHWPAVAFLCSGGVGRGGRVQTAQDRVSGGLVSLQDLARKMARKVLYARWIVRPFFDSPHVL